MWKSSGGENITMAVQDQQQLQGSRKGKQWLELYVLLEGILDVFLFLIFSFTNILYTGCWFGDKNNEQLRVWVEDVEPNQLAAADAETDPGKLAQALLKLISPHDVLASGCVAQPWKSVIVRLDQEKLQAIQGKRMTDKGFNIAMVLVAIVLMWYVINDIPFLQFMSTIGSMWESCIHSKKQSDGRTSERRSWILSAGSIAT